MSTVEIDHKQALTEYVEGLGLTYQATFQPTPQPRETVKHPQIHWLITLSKGKQSAQFPYSEGVGHVKGYKQHHKTAYDERRAQEGYRKTCETGKLYRYSDGLMTWMSPVMGEKVQPAPDMLDVLYCLVSDSDVLNYSTYEQWGPELGYDIDSRKGEEIYRQCVKQSLALKQIIGYAALEKLRGLYQDY